MRLLSTMKNLSIVLCLICTISLGNPVLADGDNQDKKWYKNQRFLATVGLLATGTIIGGSYGIATTDKNSDLIDTTESFTSLRSNIFPDNFYSGSPHRKLKSKRYSRNLRSAIEDTFDLSWQATRIEPDQIFSDIGYVQAIYQADGNIVIRKNGINKGPFEKIIREAGFFGEDKVKEHNTALVLTQSTGLVSLSIEGKDSSKEIMGGTCNDPDVRLEVNQLGQLLIYCRSEVVARSKELFEIETWPKNQRISPDQIFLSDGPVQVSYQADGNIVIEKNGVNKGPFEAIIRKAGFFGEDKVEEQNTTLLVAVGGNLARLIVDGKDGSEEIMSGPCSDPDVKLGINLQGQLLLQCGNETVARSKILFTDNNDEQTDHNDEQNSALSFPLRGAFYYLWFPNTWEVKGDMVMYETWYDRENNADYQNDKNSRYHSDNEDVIKQHLEYLSSAHVDVGIASWWGQGREGESLPKLLRLTQEDSSQLKWAFYYEKEGFDDGLTAEELASDLEYIKENFIDKYKDVYAQIEEPNDDSKPVIFVYSANDKTCELVDRWREAINRTKIKWHVVLKVFRDWRICDSSKDDYITFSWHQYGPDASIQKHSHLDSSPWDGLSSCAIAPGYRRSNYDGKFLKRDASEWKNVVKECVESDASWQLISTFNEWGEGTSIEPAYNWNYYNEDSPDKELENNPNFFIDVLGRCKDKNNCDL